MLAVLEYNLVGYRRTWRASALSSFVLPLLTVLGFGLSVGGFVDQGIDGVPYLDWVVPGLLASTAVNVALSESTFRVFSGFEWIRVYFAQLASPLRVSDMLAGHLAFVLVRVLASCAAFLAVMAAFGTLHSPWALATLPASGLVGLAVAAPVHAYTASIRFDGSLTLLFRFAVIPMTLFSGAFFPVESLPVGLRALAYALPLWHGVDLCRAATLGVAPDWSVSGHLLYLAVWAAAGFPLALRQFRRRLVI
ncbi:MAG: ABC transporter permease [Micromonosporaceae bacterium]|jgi:lipooligosaccharide transport system permease protein|nr:ABC transporter permease [Micromonosporaceae bacterium]